MDKPTIQVGSKKIEIWPEGQSLVVKVDPMIRVTRFDDIDDYHPGLIAQILAMERQGEGVRTRTSLPRTPFLPAWNRGSGRLAWSRWLNQASLPWVCKYTASELKSGVWLA